VELYLHSANTPFWRGAQLKHRDNIYRLISLQQAKETKQTGMNRTKTRGKKPRKKETRKKGKNKRMRKRIKKDRR
jgi:hypothetical protein